MPENLARLVLRSHARGLDHFHIGPRAAVADGRFVGVQFHQRVVNAPPGKGGQDMLDGLNFHVAAREGRGAGGGADVLDAGIHLRRPLQIHPPKTDAAVGRGRQKSHVDTISAMQADAGKTG